jgi:hypothetical protein
MEGYFKTMELIFSEILELKTHNMTSALSVLSAEDLKDLEVLHWTRHPVSNIFLVQNNVLRVRITFTTSR